ncbi:transposase [bacterium]|nr:transposase [bacterium]
MPPKYHDVGHIHFTTLVVNNRQPVFALDEAYCHVVIDNLKFYRDKFKFNLYGFVIMSEHIHLLIQPSETANISKILEDMNKYIARQILSDLKAKGHPILQRLRIKTRLRKGHKPHEYRLFQKDDYDFNIFTPDKLREKLQYIHENPVSAGLVSAAIEYPFSSARNYELGDHSLIQLDELPLMI